MNHKKEYTSNVMLSIPNTNQFSIVSSDIHDLATIAMEYFLPNNHPSKGSLWVKENFNKIVRLSISAEVANKLKPYSI